MRRRTLLAAGAAGLAACGRDEAPAFTSRWVGASAERGHRLRDKAGSLPAPAVRRRAGALVLGGGIAGLSALRALVRAGHDDAQLLELEDEAGGNSRGHEIGRASCRERV